MKVAIETLGCRVNIYDSEAMAELFKKDDYSVVDFTEKADVYVINTCTVTNAGDKKSRQMIGRAKKANPDSIICVVGCYAQVAADKIAEIPGVDVVLGSRNKSLVVDYANRALATGEKFSEVSEIMYSDEFEKLDITEYRDKTRAFMKIQDGCNRFCTYCMIPYARGGISSKDKADVLKEIYQLKENGFKEVILSGIHIASYGIDKAPRKNDLLSLNNKGYDLLDLLEEIDKKSGMERIRIGSIEPMFFQGDRLGRIKKLKSLMPHFHLSLQSGSDTVLKRMNRRYTSEEYCKVVEALREAIPGVSITTDVITGFPGETDDEFFETLKFLERLRLTKTHVFKYSPREGTKAASMDNQISGAIKDERSKILIQLSDLNELEFIKNNLGSDHLVLFEEEEDGEFSGYTENYIRVSMKSDEMLTGQIRKIRISEPGIPTSTCELL
ncbi:MAG: tRNA (N(6)-L-threonylcarbamoyladenosine(37)-C(2))-methylthiotransferase MtaB [Clostridiaceae bacterium]